jgi:hypothetical protein
MGMIAKVEILSVCNVPTEMDMEDIFDICQDANQPGARVDYLRFDLLGRVCERMFVAGATTITELMFQNGAVVVWTGHTTHEEQLAEAVIKELEGDEG